MATPQNNRTAATQNKKAPEDNFPPEEADFALPADVEMEDLRGDFVRPIGFLRRPNEKDKRPNTLAGVVRDVVSQEDSKYGKDRHWFAIEATEDQPTCEVLTKDGDIVHPKRGDRVGVSETGAISALVNKKGHYAILRFTGKQIDTGKGNPMWECLAKTSKAPVV